MKNSLEAIEHSLAALFNQIKDYEQQSIQYREKSLGLNHPDQAFEALKYLLYEKKHLQRRQLLKECTEIVLRCINFGTEEETQTTVTAPEKKPIHPKLLLRRGCIDYA